MSYSERAFAGPDWQGRTFPAEPVAHCAALDDHKRLARIRAATRQAEERRSPAR